MNSQPLLAVAGLNAYYGSAHVLQDVSFELGEQAVSIVGRNGMGKTTLCSAIMGGIGYVPQGRRLFPSLSVDEHLRMAATGNGGRRWTVDSVYELFPRLAQRKRNGGAQLSGGEQQMLAIGRALVTNPTLLIMDEPSEGLAPTIIEMLIETFRKLEEEGMRILVIEQNFGVATSLADRQLVMVGGEIAAETTAAELSGNAELQRRYLGVEPVAEKLSPGQD